MVLGMPKEARSQFPPPPRSDSSWYPLLTSTFGPVETGMKVSTVGTTGIVYAAGEFYSGSRRRIRVVRWTGSTWEILGEHLERASFDAFVSAIAVDS